ncbi:IclR family transcriptional regulator [Kineosporia babensis]|uniref:Helix-turn-helix domain-containing protein n=1 Tax=Kineosporia babensis TaxID=499548 RepID=A0A9X1SVB5_9ACTN|nr:IclR family transcriptional regulator [Kineosporia babensis]MCD5312655.1 helix-turn-helix domain-containing protein [Kineosporia babensis]
MPGKPPASSSTRSVERALALLAAVCTGGTDTLVELARTVELPVSTTLRLLRTLEQDQFVTRAESGGYRPGPRMMQLGAQALSHEHLVPLSRAALNELVAQTGESAYLSVPGPGQTALYLAMAQGTHSVRHAGWVGRSFPLEGSAAGGVLLGRTPEQGWTSNASGIEPDVTAMAAPVTGPGGVVAALSIVGPTYRLDQSSVARFGPLLSRLARELGQCLGGTPAQPPAPVEPNSPQEPDPNHGRLPAPGPDRGRPSVEGPDRGRPLTRSPDQLRPQAVEPEREPPAGTPAGHERP